MITATATLTGTITATAQIRSVQTGACADATVENSNSSYSETVASGGSLVLPDITFTDSDGSTSSVPSVQDITATLCPTIASVSLASTNSLGTPSSSFEFGETATLTATATGFTGTVTYYFAVLNSLGAYDRITQVGDNTYDYVCPYAGTFGIEVVAVDGFGNRAVGFATLTVGTLQDKYSFLASYLFKDATLASGRIDEVDDDTGNGYTASAPSIVDRPIYYTDPICTESGSARCGQGTTQRLTTSLSILQSQLTFAAVFNVSNHGQPSILANLQFLFGGQATKIFGGRYKASVLTVSPYTIQFSTLNAAETGATSVDGNCQLGRNVVVGVFDGATFRLNVNGNITTAALSGGLSATATNFQLLNAGSDNPTYHNKFVMMENVTRLDFKTTALSTSEQDQLVSDLQVKYPNG